MKKIYGNHVGIVINNKDPENRGRCQIFIPHLSNTLFKNWNSDLKDKEFSSIDGIPKEIKTRLIATLPWSEPATPLFGGGSSASSNSSTGKTDVNPAKTLNSSNDNTEINIGQASFVGS